LPSITVFNRVSRAMQQAFLLFFIAALFFNLVKQQKEGYHE